MVDYFDFLNCLDTRRLLLIDVGCHKGGFLSHFTNNIKRDLFSIGIDAKKYQHKRPYTHFIESAIDEKEQEQLFHEYKDERYEGECDSLSEMNKQNVTHNEKEAAGKFYIPYSVGEVAKTRKIMTMRLDTVIEKQGLQQEVIHFLKIDTQGTDSKVFLSLGDYIQNCLFVQVETIDSELETQLLYKGQKNLKQIIQIFKKHGFELFDTETNWQVEKDAIFINTALSKKIEKLPMHSAMLYKLSMNIRKNAAPWAKRIGRSLEKRYPQLHASLKRFVR